MDEDTGEMHYKLEMYTYNDRIQHVVKVCEDKEWYTTTLASESTTEPLLIYSIIKIVLVCVLLGV